MHRWMSARTPASSLVIAARAVRRLRRGRSVAHFNGWSEAIFAGLAILFGIFSLTSLVVGAILGVIAWRELRWGRELGRLDARAPRALALNQLYLLAGVLGYCAWQLYSGLTGPTTLEKHPELAQLSSSGIDLDIDSLYRTTLLATYIGVAALSVVLQGMTAWWYASLRTPMRALHGMSASAPERVSAPAA